MVKLSQSRNNGWFWQRSDGTFFAIKIQFFLTNHDEPIRLPPEHILLRFLSHLGREFFVKLHFWNTKFGNVFVGVSNSLSAQGRKLDLPSNNGDRQWQKILVIDKFDKLVTCFWQFSCFNSIISSPQMNLNCFAFKYESCFCYSWEERTRDASNVEGLRSSEKIKYFTKYWKVEKNLGRFWLARVKRIIWA